MAFPDEVAALDERARSAFRWVMRSRKFDRQRRRLGGRGRPRPRSGAEPRPFASREDLVALLVA